MTRHRPLRSRLLVPFVALGLLACASAARAGWSSDPMAPTPVCTAGSDQYVSKGCSDGAGGMFVTWLDLRNGNGDIYAQHLDAHGNPLWTANGVPVCVAPNDQDNPVLCADGAGGCFIAWHDSRSSLVSADVYVVRLGSNGSPASGWVANGILVSSSQDDQPPQIVSDGAGGAYVAFTAKYSVTDSDPKLSHVGPNGLLWGPYAGTSDLHLQTVNSLLVSGGNVFVLWQDNRSGHYEIYAQAWTPAGTSLMVNGGLKLVSGGSVDLENCQATARPSGGIDFAFDDTGNIYYGTLGSDLFSVSYGTYVGGLSGARYLACAAPDANGGMFLFWDDYRGGGLYTDLYGMHVQPTGTIASGWATNGDLVLPGIVGSYSFAAADGSGGVLVAAAGGASVVMQHLDGSDNPWPLWPSGGRLVAPAGGVFSMSGDGAGNALVTVDYFPNGVTFDVFAQRVERFGQVGDPSPALAGVKDVKNDQGGHVKVSWTASSLDVQPTPLVTAYDVWRSVPAAYAANALRAGAKLLRAGEAPAAGGTRAIAPEQTDGGTIYWEFVGRQASTTSAGYSFIVPTLGDSIGGSNPYTVVKVRALPPYSSAYWETAPDSGYSVDNLPPVAPAPFAAQYVHGAGVLLTWGPNAEGDLAGYRLYRGGSAGFVPGPGNLVTQLAQTNFTDAGATPAWYKLTAYDIHGNESAPSLAMPSGTTGVDGAGPPREVFLAPVSPNPARAGSALRFGLPAGSRAELALFDAAGRRVRTLVDGERAAGAYSIAWDGRDDAGAAAASGLYFVRLRTPGRTLVERFALIH